MIQVCHVIRHDLSNTVTIKIFLEQRIACVFFIKKMSSTEMYRVRS